MTKETAQLIGAKEAIRFVSAGLIIAYLIMSILAGFSWFLLGNYQLNLLIAIVIIYLCGYFYGQLAGVAILVKRKECLLIGLIYSFLILITATFLSSLTGFFQEVYKSTSKTDDPVGDYIFRPLFLVCFVGLIPAIFLGFWFGSRIKNKGKIYDGTVLSQ